MIDIVKGEELTRPAFAAYFRSGGFDQPSSDSGVAEVDGRTYVVLHNVRGILAVYRVRGDGALKRLRRWPAELE
jgi:hypothetical protein